MRSGERASKAAGVADRSVPQPLSEILLASITALSSTGEVETACHLAGQACVALRITDPAAARRFDALLHRLTPMLTS